MSCSYYTFRQGDYYCLKKGGYVNSDTYYKYCRNYDYDDCPVYKGDTSGGCYITSACVLAMGLEDDCHELQTMRFFRDTWLKNQENGEKIISEYYEIAPKIVEEINKRKDSKDVYQKIFDIIVSPCVSKIEQGLMQSAFEIYYDGTKRLRATFIENKE